jgi:hypothetical protein
MPPKQIGEKDTDGFEKVGNKRRMAKRNLNQKVNQKLIQLIGSKP